jgi:hypothetical protein
MLVTWDERKGLNGQALQCSLMLNQDRKVRLCGQCMLVTWVERKNLNGQALQCSLNEGTLMLNQNRKVRLCGQGVLVAFNKGGGRCQLSSKHSKHSKHSTKEGEGVD